MIGTGGVWASEPGDPPANNQPPAKANRATLPDTVRRVERQTGGEVLRAEPMQRDGREVYRLKVLTSDGRVRVVQDDPNKSSDHPAKKKEKQSSGNSDEEPPQY